MKLVDNLSDLRTDESTRRRVMWAGNKMSLVCARTRTAEHGGEQRRFCAQNTGLKNLQDSNVSDFCSSLITVTYYTMEKKAKRQRAETRKDRK